jgi:hypothetical protein
MNREICSVMSENRGLSLVVSVFPLDLSSIVSSLREGAELRWTKAFGR